MQPSQLAAAVTTTTTTEIISWQWPCGATCKMVRQVTTSCPHGCRGCQGTPSAGSPPPRHHCHRQEEGTWALATKEPNAGRAITLDPASPVAAQFWAPDPNLMVQQLRELEPLLGDEAVALRVQLEEYADEIQRSKRDSAGTGRDWFLSLPANVRDVLVVARDAINSLAAFSAAPAN
ncbi:hypothetical protein ACP70R_028192 [Stipagrostis hirtigluma subsp. patula]